LGLGIENEFSVSIRDDLEWVGFEDGVAGGEEFPELEPVPTSPKCFLVL